MGLAEKRVIEECKKFFLEKVRPELLVVNGLKLDVEIEINWDEIYQQLCNNEVDLAKALVYLNEAFFYPLKYALESICADEIGRESLRAALKKIVICCTSDKCVSYNSDAYSFSNGVLKLDHARAELDEILGKFDLDFAPVTRKKIKILTYLLEDSL